MKKFVFAWKVVYRRKLENNNVVYKKQKAGDGNRTHMTSLEGWGFTIKLRPQTC